LNGRVAWVETLPWLHNSRPHWVIQCKPHVMTRLKRWFERVDTTQHGTVCLADTPATARDLTLMVERFGLVLNDADRARLDAQTEAHREREAMTQLVLSGHYQPSGNAKMALPAREYQNVAADLVCGNGSLLLADDLGLGKTVSAIAAIAQKGLFPALVVTLTHLPRQWQRELERFTPDLKTHVLEKATPYDLVRPRWRKRTPMPKNEAIGCVPDVIISNYQKLGGWAETLASMPVRSVVFDECQELRSGAGTAKYEAAMHICREAVMKLGLSATPIFNYGGEIYNVINVLNEDALGTRAEFVREWCTFGYGKPRLKDPKVFGIFARDEGLMLRRTRAEVGRELPGLSVYEQFVETDKKAMEKFGDEIVGLAKTILADTELERGDRMRASGELNYKLRRQTGMAKADFTAAFVRGLVDNGESVVLYAWHHDVYQVLRHALRDLNPAFYTGKESAVQKELEINRFKDGETKVAILSLRAGAGLDGLQHCCRTVVFGELDWSPGVHEQAIGRVHRDGQPDPVCVYFLVADAGSDPIIADTLGVKRIQIRGLRDPNAPVVEAGVDPNHMRKLAESFLRQRGELPPATEVSAAAPISFSAPEELTPAPAEVSADPTPTTEPTQLGLFEEESTAA
jgi:SNF2 family DNA or RNA helicase